MLSISTDADPANAVKVAEQNGCCNNFTLEDGGLSGTVDLVAGNQYYVESLLKEGGGGDWMTVAWRMPSEDIDSVPGGNQDGISGKYFVGKVTVNENLPALSSSIEPWRRSRGRGAESDIHTEREQWSDDIGCGTLCPFRWTAISWSTTCY